MALKLYILVPTPLYLIGYKEESVPASQVDLRATGCRESSTPTLGWRPTQPGPSGQADHSPPHLPYQIAWQQTPAPGVAEDHAADQLVIHQQYGPGQGAVHNLRRAAVHGEHLLLCLEATHHQQCQGEAAAAGHGADHLGTPQ